MTLAANESLALLAGYTVERGVFDEAVVPDGRPRRSALGGLKAVERHDLGELAEVVAARAEAEGVCFHSVGGDQAFVIDPIPRALGAAEWAILEAGLAQRVRALNAFVADVYARREIVREGIVPARVVETAEHLGRARRAVREQPIIVAALSVGGGTLPGIVK